MSDPTLQPIKGIGSQLIDDNDKPVAGPGVFISNSKILSANGTTADIPIFTVIGSVQILALYGVVTTALGNNTAAYWRLNDGSNTPAITASGGTTLTNFAAGSAIVKKGLAAAALTALNNSASLVSEPTTLETSYFSPFVAVQITAGTTNIEFVYTTSDTPTTGAITFYCQYLPIGSGSKLQTV